MFFFVVDSCAVIMWKCATLIAYFSCQSMSAVCPKKTKTDYFIVQRQQTATKRSNVWYSDLRDNCESTYDYVFHITCIMPLPGKTFHTRKCKTPNSKILSINLTHWTMKTPQNVLKLSIASHDTSRDVDATDRWLQQQSNGPTFSIRLTVSFFQSASRHYLLP